MDVDYEHRMRFERVAFCFAIYPIMSAIPNTPFSFFFLCQSTEPQVFGWGGMVEGGSFTKLRHSANDFAET
jgi:hypothetical protein